MAPPYALITAGSSIHWTEWEVAFPRFGSLLTPDGFLALIHRRTLPMPWDAELRELHAPFSARRNHRRPQVVGELEARGFFHRLGQRETESVPFFQSIDDFIAGLHSRSRFSRQRMGEQQATDFDQQVRSLLQRYHRESVLAMHVVGTVTWGTPAGGSAE